MRQAGKPEKNPCMLVRKCYRIFISVGLLNLIIVGTVSPLFQSNFKAIYFSMEIVHR